MYNKRVSPSSILKSEMLYPSRIPLPLNAKRCSFTSTPNFSYFFFNASVDSNLSTSSVVLLVAPKFECLFAFSSF